MESKLGIIDQQIKDIDERINEGKRQRDLEEYEGAIGTFEETLKIITELLPSVGSAKDKLAQRLADCYGLQGGCYRRWALDKPDQRIALLIKSINKYREGEHLEKRYGIASTYNLLNKVISQILLDSRFLTDPRAAMNHAEVEPIDARAELEKVKEEVQNQEAERSDSWILADEALINILLDQNDAPITVTYGRFIYPEEEKHPDFVYNSMLTTLRPLAELNLPMADKLREVVPLLEAAQNGPQSNG